MPVKKDFRKQPSDLGKTMCMCLNYFILDHRYAFLRAILWLTFCPIEATSIYIVQIELGMGRVQLLGNLELF